MNRVECPGLDGSNPLHFLASLGVLRLLPLDSTMAWSFQGTWFPWYECSNAGPYEWLSRGIRRGVAEHPPVVQSAAKDGSPQKAQPDERDRLRIAKAYAFLPHSEVPRVDAAEFRRVGAGALEDQWEGVLEPLHPVWILSSLNAECAPDKDGKLEPTAYSFSNGGGMQFLLKDYLSLASLVSADAVEATLQGRQTRYLRHTSLNWDPSATRSYAHQWQDPEDMPKETDVAANALAFMGLGTLPTVPTSRGSRTVGFSPGSKSFRWPIWEASCSLAVVGSLVVQGFEGASEARPRGVSAVFESRRFSASKRLYFSPSRSL